MINKEEFIKEELSKMLNGIQDETLQDVLKKLLFLTKLKYYIIIL